VDSDSEYKNTTRQIPSTDEPSLSPASGSADVDGIIAQGRDIEQECHGLLDIGEEEVIDEHQELVGGDS
jgi:hypothetical protein